MNKKNRQRELPPLKIIKTIGMNFGIWGISGGFYYKNIMPAMGSFLKGFHLSFKWSDLEPSPGVYSFSYMDTQFQQVVAQGLDLGFMIWTGNFAPDWLYQHPYDVPKCAINTSTAAQAQASNIMYFPYYYNETYQQHFLNMLAAVIEHLSTLGESILSKLRHQQLCEGTTGDESAWHGTLIDVTINGVSVNNPNDYNIPDLGGTDPTWNAWKKQVWDFVYKRMKIKEATWQMMLNPANNGYNFTYVEQTYPAAFLKYGDYSHNFNFFGNAYYSDYIRHRYAPNRITRGEMAIENVMMNWNRLGACPQGLFSMVAAALDANMTTLNVPLDVYNYLKTPDNFSYDFFNEFALPTDNSKDPVRKGFCYLRRQPDIADIDLYPESVFGTLIDPSLQKGYDASVKTINASTDNEYMKQYRITTQRKTKVNAARINAMKAYFTNNGFQYGPISTRDDDNWSYDFGMDVIEGNWYRYVRQINQFNTCTPVVRIGNPSVNQLGAFGAYTTDQMYFDTTSEALTIPTNNTITFDIWYWNEGTGTVRIFYYNGVKPTVLGTINTTNSRQYLKATFTAKDCKGGNRLSNQSDFIIKRITGINIIISLIKITAISSAPPADDDPDEEPKEEDSCRGITLNLNIESLTIKL
jgi:hypothetical protein